MQGGESSDTTARFQSSRRRREAPHHPDRSERARFLPPRCPPVLRAARSKTPALAGSTRPTNLSPQDIINSILVLKPVCGTRNAHRMLMQLLTAPLTSTCTLLCYVYLFLPLSDDKSLFNITSNPACWIYLTVLLYYNNM